MSQLFASGGQSIGASALVSAFPMNIQDWFPLGLNGLISLLFKGLSPQPRFPDPGIESRSSVLQADSLLSEPPGKSMVFPLVMYGYESWTIKKAEHLRIDAVELWCRRRLLRVPWMAGRSNQSILKETNPEYSLEGLMLKLKLQCFGHLM